MSTNNGASWISANSGFPGPLPIGAIAIDPAFPSRVFAAAQSKSGPGVYKSLDGGKTWSRTSLQIADVTSLAIDPIVPATIYAATGIGLFKSTNAGENWIAINQGLTNTDVHAIAIDAQDRLLVGTDGAYSGARTAACCGRTSAPQCDTPPDHRVRHAVTFHAQRHTRRHSVRFRCFANRAAC